MRTLAVFTAKVEQLHPFGQVRGPGPETWLVRSAELMPRPRVVGVYETVVYGPDLQALVSFYRDVLGLRHVDDIGNSGAAFRLADGGMLLVFNPSRTAGAGRAVPAHGATGPGHVAFTIEKGDHERWLASLRQYGIDAERVLTWQRGAGSIYFRDPAGNSVELIDGEAWPP
jgi:catechol 2,3-dioxygenase-like lactoylglutathione lyase family enzyme